jgi:hypothetical protein
MASRINEKTPSLLRRDPTQFTRFHALAWCILVVSACCILFLAAAHSQQSGVTPSPEPAAGRSGIDMPHLNAEQLSAQAEELLTVKSIPKIYLTAEQPVTEKDAYQDLQMRIEDDVFAENNLSGLKGQIKPRGSSTYKIGLEYGMMPYKIKLDKKANLLGAGEHKKWCLIANFIDRSYVKQFISFGIARLLRDDAYFQPKAKFVEVYLNEEYKGLYLLTESIEEDDGALDIDVDFSNRGDNVPFLLEVDYFKAVNKYYNDAYLAERFKTNLFYADSLAEEPTWLLDDDPSNDESQFPTTMILQYPKSFAELSAAQTQNLKSSVRDLYMGIQSGTPVEQLNIDAASFVDSLIACHILNHLSCYYGSSQYIYRMPGDSRIKAGPLWDFDTNMMGGPQSSFLEKYEGKEQNTLIDGLLRQDSFVSAIQQRYNDYYNAVLPGLRQYIRNLKTNQPLKSAVLRSEAKYDTWNSAFTWGNTPGDYPDPAVLRLKSFEAHIDHIDRLLFGDDAGKTGRIDRIHNDRQAWVPQ